MKPVAILYAVAAACHSAQGAPGRPLQGDDAGGSGADVKTTEDTRHSDHPRVSTAPHLWLDTSLSTRRRKPRLQKRLTTAGDDAMLTDRFCGGFQGTTPLSGPKAVSPGMYDDSITFLGVRGQFNVPKLSLRQWQVAARTSPNPDLDPTLITYVSIDGIWCPDRLAAGVMSSVGSSQAEERPGV